MLQEIQRYTSDMSDDDLQAYVYRYVIGDYLISRCYDTWCLDCDYARDEPDIGYWDCPARGDLASYECPHHMRYMDYMRVLVAFDKALRAELGDAG